MYFVKPVFNAHEILTDTPSITYILFPLWVWPMFPVCNRTQVEETAILPHLSHICQGLLVGGAIKAQQKLIPYMLITKIQKLRWVSVPVS